jgi:hypothetical protein
MKTISIYAQISGNVLQDIVFDADVNMTKEEFVKALNDGTIATTVSHGDGNGLVIQLEPEFKIIGKVVAMEALDDMEITNFEEQEKYDSNEMDISVDNQIPN